MPKPIGKRVLIELDQPEKKVGLDLGSKEKVTTGTVRFLGTSEEIILKVGDRVYVGENQLTEIKIEGKKYLMTPEEGLVILD